MEGLYISAGERDILKIWWNLHWFVLFRMSIWMGWALQFHRVDGSRSSFSAVAIETSIKKKKWKATIMDQVMLKIA